MEALFMKFSQPNTSQSSFGIPDHVKEAGEKFRQAREDAQAKAEDALKESEKKIIEVRAKMQGKTISEYLRKTALR